MDELTMVRRLARRLGDRARPGTPIEASLMGWFENEEHWLQLGCGPDCALADRLSALADRAPLPADAPLPGALVTTAALARLLAMTDREADLFAVAVASGRVASVRDLFIMASEARLTRNEAASIIVGDGSDVEGMIRSSAMTRLGLIEIGTHECTFFSINWRIARLFDEADQSDEGLIAAFAGPIATTALSLDDFAHVGDVPLLAAMLRGATESKAEGINILLHGPPGTGKTELAKALAAAAGLVLHSVGEADDDGDEPHRNERLASLAAALRVSRHRPGMAVLFDEMEDLVGDRSPFNRANGSKVFINRLLEKNPVPILWTSNAIDHLDPAMVRRMTFVLKVDHPNVSGARAMLSRIAAEEGVAADEALLDLAERVPMASSVFRPAVRVARFAGDGAHDAGERTASALIKALGAQPDGSRFAPVDDALFEADRPIGDLLEAIESSGREDVSLLLTGPPGTGKTALAHQLARMLDRPLVTRRTSDLLSKWVGETERLIAEAFAEARERGSVLLFDEVDSLLQDRSLARASWEVSQVNELLTWLDRHPLPVVAATNHAGRLDPAAMRRFLFKLDLRPLGRDKARAAFERFFEVPPPRRLDDLDGLTPGDFALVARRRGMLGLDEPAALVRELEIELAAKPEAGSRIGF